MLTEKAMYDRMWGAYPALGELLGAKRIPDGYSVSPERSLIIAGGGFFIVGNARRATTKCLPSRLTRSGDIGTAALSFLGNLCKSQLQ